MLWNPHRMVISLSLQTGLCRLLITGEATVEAHGGESIVRTRSSPVRYSIKRKIQIGMRDCVSNLSKYLYDSY
jgi:hypothetical protein